MKSDRPSLAEVTRLSEKIAALEPKQVARVPATKDGVSEETVLVIGADTAAFLVNKAPIRQIQLLDSPAWAQQGRVSIQASHALSKARSQP